MKKMAKRFMDAYKKYMERCSEKLGKEEAHKRATLLVKALKQAEDNLNNGIFETPDDTFIFNEFVFNKDENTIHLKTTDGIMSVDIDRLMTYILDYLYNQVN